MHLYFKLLAEALNDAGYDMKKTLRDEIEIPWTPYNVKNNGWKVIQKEMFGSKSTRDLTTKEVTQIYEVLNKLIAERTGVSVEFPEDKINI